MQLHDRAIVADVQVSSDVSAQGMLAKPSGSLNEEQREEAMKILKNQSTLCDPPASSVRDLHWSCTGHARGFGGFPDQTFVPPDLRTLWCYERAAARIEKKMEQGTRL